MTAEKYTSNISTTINKEVHSLLCLVVYELENMKSCKLVNKREKKSQILLLTPDELNIDTIWNKLNIDDSFLVSKVITSIQVIDKDITSEEIAKQIKKLAGNLLLGSKIFDVYTGENIEENKKSIAYSLEFGAADRTLTDDEINAILEKIIAGLEKQGAIIRK